MIEIAAGIAVDENDIQYDFVRASGRAGRTSTKCHRLLCYVMTPRS
jgi:hypothetical protein